MERDYGMRHMYKFYKKLLREKAYLISDKLIPGLDYHVTRKQYGDMCRDFNGAIMQLIIEKGIEVDIPEKLGMMCIRKFKKKLMLNSDGTLNTRSVRVDWYKTKKLWEKDHVAKASRKVVYYDNSHSDYYVMRFFWRRKSSNAKNKTLYRFTPTENWKRYLASVIKNPSIHVEYLDTTLYNKLK